MNSTLDLAYPIGKMTLPAEYTTALRQALIAQIGELPGALRRTVDGWDDRRLDTPYREGGWTVRQVIHHLVDSHLNAYIRFKLTLTEEEPTVKPYEEKRWAELADAKSGPVAYSLDMLDGLHKRWIIMLAAMPDAAFERRYVHPETGAGTLNRLLAVYAWHGRHHLAHITRLAEREGWDA
jgi:hypothetical protein